jgi:hypothetical protein
MSTLQDYLYLTQQLLRDANNRFFSVQFLTLSINNARDKVVIDSLVTRTLPRIALVPNQETYSYQTILAATLTQSPAPAARQIATILNVNFNQTSGLNPPLRRMAWSDFNRTFRVSPLNSFPLAWAQYDLASTIYIHPLIPATGYTAEIDCVYLPTRMVNVGDSETTIPDPVTELVPFYAAFWATQYEQDATRANQFASSYETMKDYMLASMPPWSVMNRYT